MKLEEIKSLVEMEMGEPTICSDLDDSAWEKIFLKAKVWFRAKKGVIRCWKFNIVSGKTTYDVPPDFLAVVDVALPASGRSDWFNLGITELIPTWALGAGFQGNVPFDLGSYQALLNHRSSMRHLFGSTPTWWYECDKLHVSGGSYCGSGASGPAVLFYKTKEFSLEELNGRDEDLIYRYCLAVVKQVVGRIRSKYSTYPAANGGISMDGESLIAEALQSFEALDREIWESQGPMGTILTG